MSEPVFKNCFVCGQDNPIGLKLNFQYNENTAWCFWETHSDYEGYPGIIHGGIISTLLDEVMAKTILSGGQTAVTTELNIKYKKPALVNKKYKVTGTILYQKKRMIECSAIMSEADDDKHIIAEAKATYWKIDK
ncbi:MAG: PaaI family thioesterase [Candidatus Cloacimonetes bacterium]|nr:PaaI family thioesterase [Candidatus Cloacimonadota bacterium]HPM03990.1 PaaI family thioesterase [Candidatus Cloacimonadota bacterium]